MSIRYVTREDIEAVRRSPLFDSKWYLETYPDAKSIDWEPAEHYLRLGWLLDRDPSPNFNTARYIASNRDIADLNINPLVHYILRGEKEGRHIQSSQSVSSPGPMQLLVEYPTSVTPQSYNGKAVVYHLFYPELVLEAIETINDFDSSYDKIFTISETLPNELLDLIRCSTSARLFVTKNSGKDLYPFWLLIKQGILDQYGLVCKLHGKKSLHRVDGDEWRKLSLKILCGTQERIRYIENIFIDNIYPGLCFVAPKPKALLETKDRHWLGNMYWLKVISSRLGKELEISEVSGKPIMAGSFYWLNEAGISKFRRLPITHEDWKLNDKNGNRIDGNLEHFVERVLLLHSPFELFYESLTGFVENNGGIEVYRPHDEPSATGSVSEIENQNHRSRLQVNINNLSLNPPESGDIIGVYKVILGENNAWIKGYIVDLCHPAKRFRIIIYHQSKLVCKLVADQNCDIGAIGDISDGNYGFSTEIAAGMHDTDIRIYEEKSGVMLSLISASTLPIETTRALLIINRTTSSSFVSPERVRQMRVPVSKYLSISKVVASETVKEYVRTVVKEDEIRIPVSPDSVKHVFVVNNPIAEIAVARIIEKQKLLTGDVLIILHRVGSASMLSAYSKITSDLKDVEQLFVKDDLLDAYKFTNSVLTEIGAHSFILYAHHYFAVFTHALGMHPMCIQVNLIEEGKLSSVPNWEAQHASKISQYTNQKALINITDGTVYSNSVLQTIGISEFDFFNFVALKRHFPRVLSNPKTLLSRFGLLFEEECRHLSLEQYVHLLLLRRYYLWHPKMVQNHSLYSLSKAFSGMCGVSKIDKPSAAEKSLMRFYREKLGEQYALILLPSIGRFGMFSEFNQDGSSYVDFFRNITPESKIFYLLHPASRVDQTSRLAAEQQLEKYPVFKILKAQDLCDVLGKNPVTEVAATCFRYVVHYGSSLSLVLQQYKTRTVEIYLDKFK